jgi:hypothetical protein
MEVYTAWFAATGGVPQRVTNHNPCFRDERLMSEMQQEVRMYLECHNDEAIMVYRSCTIRACLVN